LSVSTKARHETTGTARRAAHEMSGRGVIFQMADEIRGLRTDLEHTSGERAAKTFAKTEGLRVTLVLLKAGATMNPEAIAGGASVHVVEGGLRLQSEGELREIGPGELVVLGANLREPITAVEESAFLVTVAWPAGAGAWQQEATNHHL
jgi:quercetin dioxygenase-like cupin family protein